MKNKIQWTDALKRPIISTHITTAKSKHILFLKKKKMSENNCYCLMISCLLFPVLWLLKPVLFLTFWFTNFSWVFWHVSEHVCQILSMCITWIKITALRLMDLLASLHFDTTCSSIFDLYIYSRCIIFQLTSLTLNWYIMTSIITSLAYEYKSLLKFNSLVPILMYYT